jgi:transcription antitermination protein NusB
MKTASDPRHQHRRHLVQKLFTYIFDPNQTDTELSPVLSQLSDIDKEIEIAAPEWPLSKINNVDLSILRLATYELTVVKKEPVKVIIDEAVELAKEFGADGSPAFVNGALGAIVKKMEPQPVIGEIL